MRDIERELRALGDRERKRDGGAQLDRRALHRIRLARMFTSGVSLIAILGLVAGGTYAASAFQEPNDVKPAEEQRAPGERPDLFFSSIDGERVTLALFPSGGFVCYSRDAFGEGLSRVALVEAESESPRVTLFPNEGITPGGGQSCTGGFDPEALASIAESPDAYRLLVEENGKVVTGELYGPDQAAAEDCGLPLGFTPTFLPPDWPRGFVPLTDEDDIGGVLGHFGAYSEAQGGDLSAGFVTVATQDMPFLPPESAELEILGSPATLEESQNGVYTVFSYGGCRYTLYGFGLDNADFIKFAEGLEPVKGGDGSRRSDEGGSGFASLDDRATALLEQLGDLCPSFDFQLKEDVGGGTVRPIHCQENGIEETHLRVFVFTDGEALEAWRSDLLLRSSSHPERQEKVEFGEDWAIVSFDGEILELAAERLGEE